MKLGIPAKLTRETELPFPVAEALRFDGQARFHPLKLLRAVAGELTLFENTPVRRIEGNALFTPRGTVRAEQVVFALDAELLLLPICFVWFCEGISDVLQVFWFRVTGKRLFKMAPIHHHFELCGWSEVRVVFVFSFISALFCALSYWIMVR